jgi:hypothetical protein
MENVLEQNIFEAETFEFKPLKRTDIHRPSAINPSEYQFVAYEFLPGGAWQYLAVQREIIRNHMARTGGNYSGHDHGGNCMVCGNVLAIYTVLFYHEKSNTYVRMGDICARKVEMAFDNSAFNRFKDTVNGWRRAVAGKNKAMNTLMEKGYGDAWDLFETREKNWKDYKYEENTICDIVGKLVRYGNISDKQMNFIGRLLTQIDGRVVIAKKRAEEKALAAPVPTGRFVIEGKIVSRQYKSDIMYPAFKITVKHVSGWCVYGTLPASLEDAKVGDFVTFSATVEVSDGDQKFGFFSRPACGKILPGPSVDDILTVASQEVA